MDLKKLSVNQHTSMVNISGSMFFKASCSYLDKYETPDYFDFVFNVDSFFTLMREVFRTPLV